MISSESPPTQVNYLDHWNFPKPPREEQVQVLDFISGSKVNTIIVGAPTGTGKSGICATLAAADTGVVVTPHKLLQDQYVRDWPTAALIKGKHNYPCETARTMATGTRGDNAGATCKVGGKWCKDEECPYKCAKSEFLRNPMGVTNYDWLLSSIKGNLDITQKWLLFDEAHELEPKLIDSATVELTEELCDKWRLKLELFDDEDEAKEWLFNTAKPAFQDAYDKLEMKMNVDSKERGIQNEMSLSELSDIIGGIGFYEMLEKDESWVYSIAPNNKKCSWKPLFASGLFSRFITPLKMRHLITSATLSPAKMLKKWLGIDACDEISVPSPFPAKNRTVFLKPMAYLNRNNMNEKLPTVVKAIDMILEDYSREKGIIHCHSFALGRQIYSLSKHKNRILLHDGETGREQLLHMHCSSKAPTVIMSPSMTEGVDLADDLSRFNIFPKCPYPNLGDKWVQRRKDEDPDWCDWQIAKTLMQGVGRSVRHAGDYAETYILDGVLANFYLNNKGLFPKWFRQAVVDDS